MSANIIQARYDVLATVANRFGGQAQANKELVERVRQAMRPLEGGGWQGRGSTAFFSEMNGEVLPAMQRLAAALDQARSATHEISRVVQQAEEEAARPFRSDGAAALAVGVAAAGGMGSDAASPLGETGAAPRPMDTGRIFSDSYMDNVVGSQIQGADSARLNRAMEQLAGNPTLRQVNQALDQIAQARGLSREDVRAQYQRYQELKAEAERIRTAKELDQFVHDRYMGSTTQLRSGKVVGDALGLDPVFGAMLNPTGGLVGPGNAALDLGNSPLSYHGVMHDAAGYLYNYHNLGPGYDYLGLEGREKSSPFSGQQAGIQYWTSKLDSGFVESTLSNADGTLLGVVEDVKTRIFPTVDVASGGTRQAVNWFDDLFD